LPSVTGHDTRPHAPASPTPCQSDTPSARPWLAAGSAAAPRLAAARARPRRPCHYIWLAQREGGAGKSRAQDPSPDRH